MTARTLPPSGHDSASSMIKITGSLRRFRLALALLLALAGALLVVSGGAGSAHAEEADRVDDLKINYRVDTDGVLHVKETWVWRFGTDSGRHGIQRELVTREPDQDNPDKDIVYGIGDFTVGSPDDIATDVQEIPVGDAGDRDRSTVYRIGSASETISADTATYVINYQVSGSLRSFDDYDELYWDATGFGVPQVDDVTITAQVPGGARDVSCNVGPVGSTADCDKSVVGTDDLATFGQADLAAGENVTIGVKINSGLIIDNQPHLVRKAGPWASFLESGLFNPAIVILLISIAIPVVGIVATKIKFADQRYLDLAPGTVPAAGTSSRIGNAGRPRIPVRFDPPPISVAEAGLLIDGQVDAKDTTATLIDLAARGSIRLEQSGNGIRVQRIKPVEDAAPHEASMFAKLFTGGERTKVRKHSLAQIHRRVVGIVRGMAESRNWFSTVPSPSARGNMFYLLIPAWIVGGVLVGVGLDGHPFGLLLVLPLIALLLTGMKIMAITRRGQRTADGRAALDHVEGFRKYLKTAEADQLKFEEGEDIFSKYLPWAIIFGLTQRWQRVCTELIAAGRLPDQSPAWYQGGDGRFAGFNLALVTSAVGAAARPQSSSGSSGSGSGSSGSSFSGGGGSSGGGGGGGGASSW